MRGKISLTHLMVLLFVFFLLGVVSLPLVNADWPTYHSDASHSGMGIGNSTITLLFGSTRPGIRSGRLRQSSATRSTLVPATATSMR